VTAAARAHYNCLDGALPGMEIEDGGGGGTMGSHWEKRVAMTELMNGVAEKAGMYLSAITLAYFDDSGWYQVNYGRAEALPWGNGEGCAFATQKCSGWSSRYLCTQEGLQGCTADMRAVAMCNYRSTVVPDKPYFQYFGGASGGGASEIPDYCPYYVAITSRDCANANGVAFFVYGEQPGAGARCFQGTYQRATSTLAPAVHGGCLQTACDPLTNSIVVTLTGTPATVVRCPRAGGVVDLATVAGSGYVGTLNCPRVDTLCTGDPCAMNDCSHHGTCNPADGTCACYTGYYGADAYTCDRLHCPTAVPGTECSGHGTCNYRTGVCEDGTGLPGCAAGYEGAACATLGCPRTASPACPTPGVPCECGGRGACTAGACNCTAGYVGSGCQYTDCPVGAPGGPRCSGPANGACDGATGVCTCLDSGAGGGSEPFYTAGPACEATYNGSRPLTPLRYMFEAGNATAYPYNGSLAPKEYAYFTFPVPSIAYSLQVRVRVADVAVTPRVTAAYAGEGLPTASTAAFFASSTGVAGEQAMDFVTESLSRFTHTGDMVVAVEADRATNYSLTVTRAGCSTLRCAFGRCADSACHCDAGWMGPTCAVPDCPGTPDCGARGSCVADACYADGGVPIRFCAPVCACSAYFTGPACDTITVDAATTAATLRFSAYLLPLGNGMSGAQSGAAVLTRNESDGTVVISVTQSAVLDVGAFHTVAVVDPRDFARYATGPLGVYMSLSFDGSSDADGLLLAAENVPPELALVGRIPLDFDAPAWRRHATSHAFVHRLANNDASTVYLGRVFNGRYGTGRLGYTFHMEIAAGVCPPALGDCSGHGVCDLSTYTCACDAGYAGLTCGQAVTTLSRGDTVVGPLPPAAWAYYALPLAADDVQVRITLTATTGQPALTAALDTTVSVRAIGALTSDAAMIDSAGNAALLATLAANAAAGAAVAALPPLSLLVRRQRNELMLLVGVSNSGRARTELRATLRVDTYNATATPVCAPENVTCQAAACHGHGSYVADPVSCRCDQGWDDRVDCASPRFASLGALLQAAQGVGALCSVCHATPLLNATGDMRIYAVPQALQKGTSVRLAVSGVSSSVGQAADTPAVLVAPVLPRSLLDFTMVAASSSVNQTLVLPTSYTGVHFAAVLAQSGGGFSIEASRDVAPVPTANLPSTWSQLREWVINTRPGRIVLGIGGALLLIVLAGCGLQCATTRTMNEKLDAMFKVGGEMQAMHAREAALAAALATQGDAALASKPALRKLATSYHGAAGGGASHPPAATAPPSGGATGADSAAPAPAPAPATTPLRPTPPSTAKPASTPLAPTPPAYAPRPNFFVAPTGAPAPPAGMTPYSMPRYDWYAGGGAPAAAAGMPMRPSMQPSAPRPPMPAGVVPGAFAMPSFQGSNPMMATMPPRGTPSAAPAAAGVGYVVAVPPPYPTRAGFGSPSSLRYASAVSPGSTRRVADI